jgi:hypothetical protein
MASLTTATRRPAAAPASPFFTESLLMTRLTKEGSEESGEARDTLFCIEVSMKSGTSAVEGDAEVEDDADDVVSVVAVDEDHELAGDGLRDGSRGHADDAGELEDEDGHGFSKRGRRTSSSFLSLGLIEHCTGTARGFTSDVHC